MYQQAQYTITSTWWFNIPPGDNGDNRFDHQRSRGWGECQLCRQWATEFYKDGGCQWLSSNFAEKKITFLQRIMLRSLMRTFGHSVLFCLNRLTEQSSGWNNDHEHYHEHVHHRWGWVNRQTFESFGHGAIERRKGQDSRSTFKPSGICCVLDYMMSAHWMCCIYLYLWCNVLHHAVHEKTSIFYDESDDGIKLVNTNARCFRRRLPSRRNRQELNTWTRFSCSMWPVTAEV